MILLLGAAFLQLPNVTLISVVHAQPPANSASLRPSRYWGMFAGSSGDVEIDVGRPGIAVRVEIPRELLNGVVYGENDTHFIQSDIRNDYYYYSLVDESRHWTYGWRGNASDGPCYKPKFTMYDPNAPWCLEIWNYLNGTFRTFTPPKFIRFISLNAPVAAGTYNFTLYVANRTNSIGYPDFVNAWNKTIPVPVSLSDNPASIYGYICDADNPSFCQTISTKGVVYATNNSTGQVARAYVNQTNGFFNVTGLSPGTYYLQGSAGIFNVACSTGTCPVAYSLSDPPPPWGNNLETSYVTVQRGSAVGVTLRLHRAPQICGDLNYFDGPNPLAHSLSDHPFLTRIGFKVLNITIEATDSPSSDSPGRVFGRFQGVSSDGADDAFRIITGMGARYVGLDPLGSEFAGLPSITSSDVAHPQPGAYALWVHVWVSGYLQKSSEEVYIVSMPGIRDPGQECNGPGAWGNFPSPNPVRMSVGGLISGTIQFRDLTNLQSPHDGETTLGLGPPYDTLLGGNIVVEAYDHSGVLRGVTVLNGTRADGKTIYANSTSVRFNVIGFSEFYNRTWAGSWHIQDYGLPADTYSVTVLIRGYEENLANTPLVTVLEGTNSTITVPMIRGGVVQVTVGSYDNRVGTRAIQAPIPWRFLNLSIPVKARVYFYDNMSRTIGYVERQLVEGEDHVTKYTFVVNFAGQNWSLREIWFYGELPTHLSTGNYTAKAFTLGYVQRSIASFPEELTGLAVIALPLLVANEIDLVVPIFSSPDLLGQVPEHAHALGEAYTTSLAGALAANVTVGTKTIDFPIFGFGATLLNTTSTSAPTMAVNASFNGQGHFFYVAPDGSRYFDYGLEGNPQTGVTYTTQVPDFGFSSARFMSVSPVNFITFMDLFLEKGAFEKVVSMAKIIQGTPTTVVEGFIAGICTPPCVMPLSSVRVQAGNSSIFRFTVTVDGQYDGVEALFVPAGKYNITFSVAWYYPQTAFSVTVNWSGTYSILPPDGPLCPLADPSVCPIPPSPSPSYPVIEQGTITFQTVEQIPPVALIGRESNENSMNP